MQDRQKTLSEWNAEIKSALAAKQLNVIQNIFNEFEFRKAVCFASAVNSKQEETDLEVLKQFFLELIDIDIFKETELWPNPTSLFETIVHFISYIEEFYDVFSKMINDLQAKNDKNKLFASFLPAIEKLLLYLSKQHLFSAGNMLLECFVIFSFHRVQNNELINTIIKILEPKVNYSKILYNLIVYKDSHTSLRFVKEILENKKDVSIKYIDSKKGETALHSLLNSLDLIIVFQLNVESKGDLLIQLFRILIAYDMSILEVKNKNGKTALHNLSEKTKIIVNQIIEEEKKTRLCLRKTLLCYLGFFKSKSSPLYELPRELSKKISTAILESELSIAPLNMSEKELKKAQEEAQLTENQLTFPRLKWQ